MYFNPAFTGELPAFAQGVTPPFPREIPSRQQYPDTAVTVLKALDYPVNKRFYRDANGEVQKQSYQYAYRFSVEVVQADCLDDLARLITSRSRDAKHILIRGLPVHGLSKVVQRQKENFPEHPDGTPWVMLDFDNITLPPGVDPLSKEAIELVISKLPEEFRNASYFYQFSASAGILKSDGTLMKTGLNVHLFFWLNRRVLGRQLSAYLCLHCLQTDFYTLGENRGGVVQLSYGVDPAPIRSEVQPHFISAPTIEEGVRCLLTSENTQGLVRKSRDTVILPPISAEIGRAENSLKNRLVDEYKRTHGYTSKRVVTRIRGQTAVTRYSVAPSRIGSEIRTGRPFAKAKLSDDEQHLTLYFADEHSPGSWYVSKSRPQIGVRFGDGKSLPLKELSHGAHDYVRDVLGWFSEVPHKYLDLVEGFLPPLESFATAKTSLVLAPTGSGKTTAAVSLIRSRIAQGQLVLYAAPTIALVKQMRDDLMAAELNPHYYDDLRGIDIPRSGVIVTTYETLPRLLHCAYEDGIPHSLIFDEIHHGLDWFMRRDKKLKEFEAALGRARQSLLLTGTLTDVQRRALVEISKHALGSLEERDYCGYEFSSNKRNPLHVLPTSRFDSDLATLLQDFQEKVRNGNPLPRFVLLMDTSKMAAFRLLLEQYGLSDYAMVISRPENSPAEIEAARTSIRPILICSPLFALGLNFSQEPAVLWACFNHVAADTSQIIQTVNRANRGQVQCEVRIYGNVHPDAEFTLPGELRKKNEVAKRIQDEASLAGRLEEHFHLDRVTYLMLREAERNSNIALSVLFRENSIQNFTIVEADDLPVINKDRAKVVKAARAEARDGYRQAITDEAARFARCRPMLGLIKLEHLHNEWKYNWKSPQPRLERSLREEEAGIVMACFGISEPVAAQKVSVVKIRRLFGEASPWISSQYDRERHPDWAKVEAEKTDRLLVLLEKLQAFRDGPITVDKLSVALTRNDQIGEAFLALAGNDMEFQSIGGKIENLKQARAKSKTQGGHAARAEVQEQGLKLLRELLEPIGVAYAKKEASGRLVTDIRQPIVPASWNLPEMTLTLKRQAARLRALPRDQTEPIVPMPNEPLWGAEAIPRQVCESCVFFHQNACSRGIPMDWQSYGEADPVVKCAAFKRIKAKLVLH